MKTKLKNSNNYAPFIWNFAGSFFSSLASLTLTFFVVHISGNAAAGIFSLAFAGSQLMLTIGCFDVRMYQATDVSEKFKFSDYYTARIFTCILMIVISFFYVWWKKYYLDDTAIVMLILCGYRVIDAVSDVFQGLFQQKMQIEVAGKMLTFKVVLSTFLFGVVLFITKNLIFASLGMFFGSLVLFIFYDYRKTRNLIEIKFGSTYNKLRKLFLECFPLFACAYMLMYVFNAPRNSIYLYMTVDEQGYYSQLFMPAAVMNLILMAFRPLFTRMAYFWSENEIPKFLKYTAYIVLGILFFTVLVLAGGYLLGIPILSVFFTKELIPYKTELMIILLGGGANSLANILYNSLTIMRKQYSLLIGYILTSISAFLFTNLLVSKYGLMGAASSFLLSMTIFLLAAVVLFLYYILKEKKKSGTLITDYIGHKRRLEKMDSIIFDLDGTLWDSREQAAKAWDYIVKKKKVKRAEIVPDELTSLFGKPMDAICDYLFPEMGREEREELGEACFAYENEYLLSNPGMLYNGVSDMIKTLAEKIPLYIVSNCGCGYIEAFLQVTGLSPYFQGHLCYGDTNCYKGENLKILMEKHHLKQSVYVGDIQGDADACREAGIPIIYAKYGFGTISEPDYVIEQPLDIIKIVEII